MKIEVARQISELMLSYGAKLNDSLFLVKNNSSEKEYLEYRTAVGTIMGYMFTDIMIKIYKEHPSLKPNGLEVGPEKNKR